MDHILTAQFFPLPSQGNIYTLTKLEINKRCQHILVASLKKEVFFLKFCTVNRISPLMKEVQFCNLPSGEIVALDAFNKSDKKSYFVVGITLFKNSTETDKQESYLHIYSEWKESEEIHIDNIARNCSVVELNFVPYHLLHTYLVTWEEDKITNREYVFLLSGSDHLIHAYRENSEEQTYREIEVQEFFPEFAKTPSPIIYVDIHYSRSFKSRVAALGCECGYVRFTKVDVQKKEVKYAFSTKFNVYISSVRLYYERKENLAKANVKVSSEDPDENENLSLNMIVVNSHLPAVIFEDIVRYGLTKYSQLSQLDSVAVKSGVNVMDCDFDGRKEVIIGNSGTEIMLFKWYPENGWFLDDLKYLESPVYAIKDADLNNDGVKEIIILTMKGLIIFEYEDSYVKKLLRKKIKKLNNGNISKKC